MFTLFFSPSGRIDRKTWWLSVVAVLALSGSVALAVFVLGLVIAYSVLSLRFFAGQEFAELLAVLFGMCVFCWCAFAVSTKRFHDLGFPAWANLIVLVPFVGLLVWFLILGLCPGDDGLVDNRYGD